MSNVATRPEDFTRVRPLLSLGLTFGFIVLHHMNSVSQGEIYPKLLLFLSIIAGMAFAGCVHPPVFFALTKYGSHLPMRYKVIGGMCAAAGFAAGMYALMILY